jgi:Tol biopolymer transport system component
MKKRERRAMSLLVAASWRNRMVVKFLVGVSVLSLLMPIYASSANGKPSSIPGKIAFQSWPTSDFEIMMMNDRGQDLANISNSQSQDFIPRLSPDGKKILFARLEMSGNHDIYVMNVDGTNVINLTNNLAFDYYPSWSPDGTKIAFVSMRDNNFESVSNNLEIYTMNADGSQVRRLTFNNVEDNYPSWSPNGKKIIYSSKVGLCPGCSSGNAVPFDLFTMNADGRSQVRLLTTPNNEYLPQWSAKNRIAFTTDRDSNIEIYAMNSDTTGLLRLTNNGAVDNDPFWSPDGNRLTFVTDRDGNSEVYVMSADGSSQVRLTNNLVSDYSPSWSK